MDKACQLLISAAIRAPSGDNTQPWRFVVDPAKRLIAIELDETRDPTPMNSGQRMARLAIGAAVENMLRAAQRWGWRAQVAPPPASALVAVQILDCPTTPGDLAIDPAITARVTNRRAYDKRPVSDAQIDQLRRATPDLDGVRTIWIHGAERIKQLSLLMGRSDALMLGEPSMRRGFLDNIRFDLPWKAAAEEGMPLGSLELSLPDRTALRFLKFVPAWVFKVFGISRKFAMATTPLVASSSGICVTTETAGTHEEEILAGRAMQRAWLALAELGLAAQPMMSLAILESVLVRGSEALLRSLGREQAEAIVAEFRTLAPELGGDHVAFVARFGYAQPPTCVTGRLPLEANTREAELS